MEYASAALSDIISQLANGNQNTSEPIRVISAMFPRATGTISLSATATTTTVNDTAVRSSSVIVITPTNAAAKTLGAWAVTTKTSGASFVLTTGAAAGGETYDYAILNPL